MDTNKQIISFLILVFSVFTINASTENNKKASFTNNVVITDVETSLSFFIPEEFQSVYVYVSDSEKNVFQKIKVYQRGNGKIICDKSILTKGVYYYTMYIDGEEVDTQRLEIKK